MRKINVGVVDPDSQTITQMEIEASLESYYEVIDCETIESVNLGGGKCLYVDEEAKLRGHMPAFYIGHNRNKILGRAILLSIDENGDSQSVTEDEVITLIEAVKFQ